MAATFSSCRLPLAAAAALCCCLTPPARAQLASVITITGQVPATASFLGFGDVPLARSPLQASVYGAQQLSDAGVASIGDLTRLNASVSSAYNAEGYWGILAVRGYTLDNRFNYRRDGLPINAETAIPLDNKERLELLEGTSGIQAGTSAPGGLINLVVKRPMGTIRSAKVEVRQAGSVLAALDLGDRYGPDGVFGVRLNAAYKRLDPQARHTQGERSMLALAADWQLAPGTLLQAEVETSHQQEASVTGFSMLGNTVPDARPVDPRINLNDQPWRQPVVFDGTTASLRWQQRVAEGWQLTAQAMQQRLKTDDRTAFPYGVYDPVTYDCPQWCDRFAPDGRFTYWQYVSDNERRTSSTLALSLVGQARTAGIEHSLELGGLASRYRGRFQDQVFDIAGTGKVDGSLQTPPSPGGTSASTDRDERNTEIFIRDVMRLDQRWQLWAGLRHTAIDRAAQRTSVDGAGSLRPTHYRQGLTAPWLAAAFEFVPRTIAYASWGQGLESEVAPNLPRYSNRGQALPALKSRQLEAGIKHEGSSLGGALTVFDIARPLSADDSACATASTCTRVIDGSERHRGIEASGTLHQAAWLWQASAMWLSAERLGSAQPGVNGTRPVNVPVASLRLAAEYRLPAVSTLALLANITAESDRKVLPYDPGVTVPGWARLDLGARWRQSLGASTLVWRVGVDNATDQRAWKESPYQFGHVYLYPLEPRTWRASVQVAL